MANMDRRSFVQGSALVAGGAALAGLSGVALADEAPAAFKLPNDLTEDDVKASCVELEPITEFAAEETYDIVVVGAGVAGVPAILTAIEEGATVGCLQKEEIVAANGYGESAIKKDASTMAGVYRWMEDFAKGDGWRINRDLFRFHIEHSEETISWIVEKAREAGVADTITGKTSGTVVYEDGQTAAIFEISSTVGNQVIMLALADLAESKGAVFHYSTPAVQLVQAEDGTVTGVIGKQPDGSYIKLNAEKAVILAAGDYMNNDAMMDHYSRDLAGRYFMLQKNRTGDGQILGILAGARMVPPCHPHQVHGVIPFFMKAPLIALDPQGKRFMNEDVYMTSWNTVASYHYPQGENTILYRFFDADYPEKYADFMPVPPKAMLDSCIDEDRPITIYDFHHVMHRADTLEALCEEVGIPYEAAKESIDRYNQLCDEGADNDFGVAGAKLRKIETAPFYCIKDVLGLAAINAGFTTNDKYQAVDAQGNVIPHLYGAGVCADNICGGINWSMPGGCSNSHCISAGRYTVLDALGLEAPTNPAKFDDVRDVFVDANGNCQWEVPETAAKAPDLW
ncbi:MAG: FAD-binding protein [Coriobacteriales bacterium]|nr:FAD-binding protein [Coriobacteriales bacterium]